MGALGLQFFIFPVIQAVYLMLGHKLDLPRLDLTALITLITGILGLGGLRTYEKIKNVSN